MIAPLILWARVAYWSVRYRATPRRYAGRFFWLIPTAARANQFGPDMRWLAVLAFLAACGGDPQGPSVPSDVPGLYVLRSIGGASLPTEDVKEGRIAIRADASFVDYLTYAYVGEWFSDSIPGEWFEKGDTVVLHYKGYGRVAAYRQGDVLSLRFGANEWVYGR